jgi:signal transduction histidine kinase
MRFTIATKLFIGFLCVIGLNTAYIVIINKINDVNAIVDILKRKTEIKNRLLRLKTLHGVQGTSIISFIKIGRQVSVENFRDIDSNVIRLIDTIQRQIDFITAIDSHLVQRIQRDRNHPALAIAEEAGLINTISLNSSSYSALFEKLVSLRALPRDHKPASSEKMDVDSLNTLEQIITGELDSAEAIIGEQTNSRIRDISQNIAEVKDATLFMVGSITLFSIIFGLIFSRTITNALRRLKESATKIGKADFDINPSGFPNDEIGDLAKAFSSMAVDLRNKQEELLKSKRLAAIGEVVASVNHEINNPLMIISGNAQFLEMSMAGYPEEMIARVKTIIEETERISEITKKMREIKNPVSQSYLASGGKMINIVQST